jgi:hypothetical protein
MFTDRQFRLPRLWSNRELRKIGPLFSGAIVNVSGWRDEDKQGGFYRAYFPNAASYEVTNFEGFRAGGAGDPSFLDLEKPLPPERHGRFDAVFNHTTLEHVYDVRLAMANLCALARDCVIVVVPFAQVQHEVDDFKDFWRFTPTALRRMFAENGLETVYEAANHDLHAGIYILMVASRNPQSWTGKFPVGQPITDAAWPVGIGLRQLVKRILKIQRPGEKT